MRTEKRYSPIEVPAGIDQVYYAVILFSDSVMAYNCAELPSFWLYQSCQWTREEISLFYNASLAHCAQVCGTEHQHDYIRPIIIWLYSHPKLLPETSRCDIHSIIWVCQISSVIPLVELIRFSFSPRYLTNADISRARLSFFSSASSFLLVSERFHFFRRYKIRGCRNVIFYAPPDHSQFYTEYLSFPFLDDEVESGDVTCRVIYSKYDRFRLERIVGSKAVGELIQAL